MVKLIDDNNLSDKYKIHLREFQLFKSYSILESHINKMMDDRGLNRGNEVSGTLHVKLEKLGLPIKPLDSYVKRGDLAHNDRWDPPKFSLKKLNAAFFDLMEKRHIGLLKRLNYDD